MAADSTTDVKAIPASEWIWRGMPGHLIVSSRCCFHMVTDIGRVRVSTIGCYHEAGDEPSYENRKPIGSKRLYETFVFPLEDGEIKVWSEIDSDGYMEEADAEAGHQAICEKWARLGGDPKAFGNAA